MKKYHCLFIVLALAGGMIGLSYTRAKALKVLVFSRTVGGYRHASIAAGKTMFLQLGKKYGALVDTTEDPSVFTVARLRAYDVIVFLSTRGDILDSSQQQAFTAFIHRGGGFVGIHAATTTEYEWPWYNKLIGAYFDGHPEPQRALYTVTDKDFPVTRSLPDTFSRVDEIYNFRSVQDSLHYLVTVNEKTYTGGKMGDFHPVSWYHSFEGGRVFYIGLGHFDAAYSDPLFVNATWNGVLWAADRKTLHP